MSELAELLTRVEAAIGPAPEINAAIGVLAGWVWRKTEGSFGYWVCPDDFDCPGFDGGLPDFAEDSNAALALVDRMLPGLVIKATKIGGSSDWQITEAWTSEGDVIDEWHPIEPRPLPLAVLTVLLMALERTMASPELELSPTPKETTNG